MNHAIIRAVAHQLFTLSFLGWPLG